MSGFEPKVFNSTFDYLRHIIPCQFAIHKSYDEIATPGVEEVEIYGTYEGDSNMISLPLKIADVTEGWSKPGPTIVVQVIAQPNGPAAPMYDKFIEQLIGILEADGWTQTAQGNPWMFQSRFEKLVTGIPQSS